MTALGWLRTNVVGTLRIFQSHQTNTNKSLLRTFFRNEASFVPKRVLIVAKFSRYQFEKLQQPDLDEEQFKQRLLSKGSDYDSMLRGHYKNKKVEEEVIQVMEKRGIEYKKVDRSNIDEKSIAWADLVLPIGGDGTFLLAANLIFDNETPIVGINSYPEDSEGYLLLPSQYTKNIPKIFELLEAGQYKVLMRSRIQTTLKGEGQWAPPFHMHEGGRIFRIERMVCNKSVEGQPSKWVLPWLALNEVFVAETQSARTSSLLLKLNDNDRFHKVKSSGLCVSTGTGSTSWYKTINSVHPQMVSRLLNMVDTKKVYANSEIENLCHKFNSTLIFNPDCKKIAYTIRDMITRNSYRTESHIQSQGFCEKLIVKSLCFDAALVLDGGIAIHFNLGTTAEFKLCPEGALKTIILPS